MVQQKSPIKLIRDFAAGRLLLEKISNPKVKHKKRKGKKFLFSLIT